MYVISCVLLAILCDKTFKFSQYSQMFQPVSFAFVVHAGNMVFYQFIPVSVNLTIAEGQQKTKSVWFVFSYIFQLMG